MLMNYQQKPIKPTLRGMAIGEESIFPKNRKKSVRTSASELKDLEGLVFKTRMEQDNLIVKRI